MRKAVYTALVYSEECAKRLRRRLMFAFLLIVFELPYKFNALKQRAFWYRGYALGHI